MITISEVALAECFEDIILLGKNHAEEVSTHLNGSTFSVDKDRYYALEEQGSLKTLIVKDSDKVVGYALLCFYDSMNLLNHKIAQSLAFYVDPPYRSLGIGSLLLSEAEILSKELGAIDIIVNTKPDTPLTGLLNKLNYSVDEISYRKRLT